MARTSVIVKLDHLDRLERPIAKWLEGTVQQAQRYASEACPVDTGRLRASIAGRVIREKGKVIGEVSANTDYAIFVHEGARGHQGRPFLRQGAYRAVAARTR